MKIRTDFVTNSSSSSFIIAHKSSAKQKEILADFAKRTFFGDRWTLTPGTPIEEVRKILEDHYQEEFLDEVVDCLNAGFEVSMGSVDFEPDMAAVNYTAVWRELYAGDRENFVPIDIDLSY